VCCVASSVKRQAQRKMLFVVPRLDAQHVGTNPTENPDVGGSHVLRTKFDAGPD
jgi:hypothetical protein